VRNTPTLYWIDTPAKGRLAVSARPRGGDWLEDEIAGWRSAGIDVVACLLTSEEATDLLLEEEASLAAAEGLRFYSLPIQDRDIPESDSDARRLINELASALDRGKSVLIHCRQGIGRAGMIATPVLGFAGVPVEDALRRVSKARGLEVPETAAQLAWVKRMADFLSTSVR
jgi:protein-tyrosine phosphatase